MRYELLKNITVKELEARVDKTDREDLRKQKRHNSTSDLEFEVTTATDGGETNITLSLNLWNPNGYISHNAEILRVEGYPLGNKEVEEKLVKTFTSIGRDAVQL